MATPSAPTHPASRPCRIPLRSLWLVLALGASTTCGAATFNILAYGADGSGLNWSTPAVQRAIDDASSAGGGVVLFPPGRYRLNMVAIKSNVTLQFAPESFVDAPRLFTEYAPIKFLFRAVAATNIAMRGPGIINGQGSNYWNVVQNPATWHTPRQSRPVPLIQFRNCRDVTVDGVTIVNSPSWTLSPYSSTNVTIRNVTIINDYFGPNTDGINVAQSKNVLITGCNIATGDDCIAIKNGDPTPSANFTSNVTISNCNLSTPSYAFKIGTESQVGVVENIIYTDCRTRPHRLDLGAHSGIALESVDGGILRNVRVSRIHCEGTRSPIFIRLGNRGTGQTASPPIPGQIHDILIEDVTTTGVYPNANGITVNRDFGIQIHGLPSATVSNITLRNIHVVRHGDIQRLSQLGVTDISQLIVPEQEAEYPSVDMFGWLPSFGVYCRHARAITLQNVTILPSNSDLRPALVFDDVANLTLTNVVASFPGSDTRTAASMFYTTNSPTISLNAQPNPTIPPGGWIFSTP